MGGTATLRCVWEAAQPRAAGPPSVPAFNDTRSRLESALIVTLQVLHVVESLAPEAGSVGVSLPGLFAALAERGIESTAVTLGQDEQDLPYVRSTRFEPGLAEQLVREASVVHAHGWGSGMGRSLARAAEKAGTPLVISPLGELSEGPHHQATWRDKLRGLLGANRLVRRAAVITAVNEAERRAVRAAGYGGQVVALPCGLRMDAYEATDASAVELPAAPDGRCLLLLGPLHPLEGFVPLMKALAEIGREADGWYVALAGRETGNWRKMLEAAIQRKGASDRVVLGPAADVATQRAWLARASVLASPSLHFRCPVSIMQAVAAGVPVVASDRAAPDGLNEKIRCCAPRRHELREALRFVLQLSDEDRAALAAEARDAGRSLFDWSVLGDQYVQLYQGLA